MPTIDEIRQLLDSYKTGDSIPNPENPADLGDIPALKTLNTSVVGPNQPTDVSDLSSLKTAPISDRSRASIPMEPTTNTPAMGGGYGKGMTDADLAAAMRLQNENQFVANMGKVGANIGAAIANVKPNTEGFDDINKQSGQMVQNVLTRRKAADEALQRKMSQMHIANEQEKMNPNSEVSRLYRDTLNKMGVNVSDNATASSIEKAFPAIEKYYQAKEMAEARKAALQEKSGEKQTKDQNQHMQNAITLLESNRGNNPDVRQAYTDRYNAEKAKHLAEMYGNPNKLSPQMVGLLTSEVAKIAKGGVPDKEEFALLKNPSIASKMAEASQKILNKPSPANASAFVKQYLDYVNVLHGNADKLIQDKIGRIIESKRKAVGEENYNQLKQQFQTERNPSSDMSDQDKQAIEWAKAHKDDNRAKQILKMHGME